MVNKCNQASSGMDVAAKFVNKKLIGVESVEKEFTILQNLQHPHLLTMYDLYDTPTSHILITEL